MSDALDQIFAIIRSIWRNRWIMFAVTWMVCLGGWVWVYFMENQYDSKARVFVDTQSLLKPLLGEMAIQPNVDQQVLLMTRTLMSRPNLERVARMTDLDLRAKTPQQQDDLYKGLAGKIKLEGTEKENLYTISFRHSNPDMAKRVVQALLTIFTETSLGGARKDLSMSTKFIEEQLKNYEARLREKEQAISEFKRRNMFNMPNQGGDYFTKINEINNDLQKTKNELSEADSRKKQLERQLSDQEETISSPQQVAPPSSPLDGRISSLQSQLDTLRLKYTDLHPEITRTKQLIARLEGEKKKEEETFYKHQSKESTKAQNPIYQQLTIAIAEADAVVATLKSRVAQMEVSKKGLLGAVNQMPQIEAEHQEMVRDYDVYKANYLELLSKRETAVISGDVETKTDVVDFRVVDPPRVSNQPAFPNRPLFISAIPLAGVVLGFGVSFLLVQLRPAIDNKRQLKEITDLPLLGVITKVSSDVERRKRRIHNLLYLAGSSILLLFYGVQMAYYLFVSAAS